MTRRILLAAVAGMAFQVFHVAEHGLQLGYWLLHPTQAPWLTPWAAWGRDVIAAQVDGQPATGAELLHLVGNALFLIALVAMLIAAARMRTASQSGSGDAGRRSLRIATWVQTAHVIEHVVLTGTWMMLGRANGVSTLFGLVPGGAIGGATRVWIHFLINAAATYWAIRGMREAGLLTVGQGMSRTTATITPRVTMPPRRSVGDRRRATDTPTVPPA